MRHCDYLHAMVDVVVGRETSGGGGGKEKCTSHKIFVKRVVKMTGECGSFTRNAAMQCIGNVKGRKQTKCNINAVTVVCGISGMDIDGGLGGL